MYTLIESIASVTHCRERDQLDAGIIQVLAQLLCPQSIRFFRVIPAANHRVVHLQVEALPGAALRQVPLPTRAGALPPLELFSWAQAWFDGASTAPIEFLQTGRCCYQFPISDGFDVAGWIEIEILEPMQLQQRRLVEGMLRILANHIQLLDYAERDSLTDLPNRKTFDKSVRRGQSLAGHGAEAAADEPGNWLAVVDIDFFKRINDQFGHLYGDEVLVLLARCMRSSFRLGDRLFRFGGEEFAILLDATTAAQAGEVFDRFRMRVQNQQFPQIGQVTVSIGYTRLMVQDTPVSAFDRADAALYRAKDTGRNRVCCWEDLHRSGELRPLESVSEVELF